MSLCCSQTREIIRYGQPIYVVSRCDAQAMTALSHEIIEQIPLEERCETHASPSGGGVDVHEATSTRNIPPFSDAYTFSGMTIGNFLFSVSRATLEKYAPLTLQEFDRCPKRTAH